MKKNKAKIVFCGRNTSAFNVEERDNVDVQEKISGYVAMYRFLSTGEEEGR